jgi:hypothetical protein
MMNLIMIFYANHIRNNILQYLSWDDQKSCRLICKDISYHLPPPSDIDKVVQRWIKYLPSCCMHICEDKPITFDDWGEPDDIDVSFFADGFGDLEFQYWGDPEYKNSNYNEYYNKYYPLSTATESINGYNYFLNEKPESFDYQIEPGTLIVNFDEEFDRGVQDWSILGKYIYERYPNVKIIKLEQNYGPVFDTNSKDIVSKWDLSDVTVAGFFRYLPNLRLLWLNDSQSNYSHDPVFYESLIDIMPYNCKFIFIKDAYRKSEVTTCFHLNKNGRELHLYNAGLSCPIHGIIQN